MIPSPSLFLVMSRSADLSKTFSINRRKPKTRVKVKTEPAPEPAREPTPEIQHWRPAGGESQPSHDEPTKMLGIARISTHRLAAFTTALQSTLEKHLDELPELLTRELVHGGESVTDVYLKFEAVEEAEAVMGMIEGGVIGERVLSVTFAEDG